MLRFVQILLGVVLGFLVARAVRGLLGNRRKTGRGAGAAAGADYGGEIVGCARCALHVPRDRAVVRRGRTYCSRACADAGPGTG